MCGTRRTASQGAWKPPGRSTEKGPDPMLDLAELARQGFTIFLGPRGPQGRPWRARRGGVVIHSTGGHTASCVVITPPRFTVSA